MKSESGNRVDSDRVVRVGIVGVGMMGCTHLGAYLKLANAKVVALCDQNPARLSGEEVATGNVEGQAEGDVAQLTDVARYETPEELLADAEVDLVDICLPTDLHMKYGLAALEAGKHVCLEKPLARSYTEAKALAAAEQQSNQFTFVAHCMRFWPGWSWLKEAVADGRYGKVKAATFRRVASHPGGEFYRNGERCGGAILDLHIHDTDFVRYLFGEPKSVSSYGYCAQTSEPDHVVTQYHYDDIPLVMAEGGWAMSDGFGFCMTFCVNFEQATAVFDLAAEAPLKLSQNGKTESIEIADAMGYDLELAHFVDCIRANTPSTIVSWEDAAETVGLIEAEQKSMQR